MPLDADIIALARSIRIEDEIARRPSIRLRGKGKHRYGPCVKCGGTDRFQISIIKQRFLCRGCHPRYGGVIEMTMWLDGRDFVTAVCTLTGIDPGRPVPKPDPARLAEARAKAEAQAKAAITDERQRITQGLSIWDESDRRIEDTLAWRYLTNHRRLKVPDGVSGEVLRFHPKCEFGSATYPCLIALVREIITDKPQGIVRTALNPDGSAHRIDGKTARKGRGLIGGGAIKLSDNAEVTTHLTIAEGVETTLAAMMPPLWSRPAWSLINKGNIAEFPVLAGIETLTIWVDNDPPDRHGRRAGQQASAECARRWDAAGREVIPLITRQEGSDIADVVGTSSSGEADG